MPTPRRRGAQPGNKNALKHGFYARSFSNLEDRDLQTVAASDLTSEIAMLRVALRRVFDSSSAATDPDTAHAALTVLGQSASRLAGLLRNQRLLEGSSSVEVAAALNQALADVVKEFGDTNA
jgi:hypothetical protein